MKGKREYSLKIQFLWIATKIRSGLKIKFWSVFEKTFEIIIFLINFFNWASNIRANNHLFNSISLMLFIKAQKIQKYFKNRILDKKIYIIIFKSLSVCLSVWPLIDSKTIQVRNMKLMSLEPVWPEMHTKEKNFREKWSEAKLPRVKVLHSMLSYEKNFSNIVINVNW
jgi:hypothetical protein